MNSRISKAYLTKSKTNLSFNTNIFTFIQNFKFKIMSINYLLATKYKNIG